MLARSPVTPPKIRLALSPRLSHFAIVGNGIIHIT
jgi:hypothetical protein